MHSVARRGVVMLALTAGVAAAAEAQSADSLTTMRAEEVLTRVRRYTSNDVVSARALVDSLVTALPAGASVYPEALFAKASIARSASEAERDYGLIVNEHRFSPRVPDALMRLALLESSRNNRVGALRHLDRLLRDHSDAPVRSRASLLAGRLRMDANDPARGCELLAAAYASAGINERDVKDQAQAVGASCPTPIAMMAQRDPPPMGIARAGREPSSTTVAAASPPSGRRNAPTPRPVARRDTALTPKPAPAVVRIDTAATAKPVAAAVPRDTAPAPKPVAAVVRRDTAPTPKPVAAVVRRDTAPTPRPAPAPATPAATPPATTPAPASTGRFGVQFAAYNDKPGAEQFASVLRSRGITARVEGAVAPFRVRAGRFSTRAEAEASAALWRRPGQPAIVVALGPTP